MYLQKSQFVTITFFQVTSYDVFFQVPVHLGMVGIIVTSAVRELSKRDLVLRNVFLVQMLWKILH